MATDEDKMRFTPLHSRHGELGANMVPFGEWEMPLWYKAGAIREHLAVIQAAGLFDTSHMDVLLVSGDDSGKFLDFAFTRDIASLRPGRCAYGAFLDAKGGAIDDGIIYPLGEARYAVVANASMGPVLHRHLSRLPGADKVAIREAAPRLAKLDIQGPASVSILRLFLENADRVLEKFPYFTFKGDFELPKSEIKLNDGAPILLSRTGYTGELGFEIFLTPERALTLWDDLLNAGADQGILPCGLAARDSLRTGAVLPLSHQDIGPWPFINHPWPFALPLREDGTFGKRFFGAESLDAASAPHTLPFAGFDPRRVDAHSARVMAGGADIGEVLTIVSDMAIGRVDGAIVGLASPNRPEGWTPKGLACGFVKVDRPLPPGTEIVLRDGRREIKAAVVQDIRPGRTARKKIN